MAFMLHRYSSNINFLPGTEGCEYVKKVRIHNCNVLNHTAICTMTKYLKKSLEHLEITSCVQMGEPILPCLVQLQSLKHLVLGDLPDMKDAKKSLSQLKEALPDCKIVYPDAEQ
ncbi:hypothetical protein CAPTEDRAFT_212781 [Capitella teleta]|uniref:Uncharacterized protein n=1 Tax=Capitella teleta TaxID=283909 RepID=R7TAW4_CAPTE|nr:hypothetical protein CAPTEDRAFT_212781 [Capitella teleta]|eukprot:ELT90657.1 hypothetical protein CAPTEDRAFT_212781 [Capitella teleta]